MSFIRDFELRTDDVISSGRQESLRDSLLWTLTLLSSDPGLASVVRSEDSQGLSVLVDMLSTPNPKIQEEVTYILTNMCGANPANWDNLVGLGGVPALLTLLASPFVEVAQVGASREIYNLMTKQPSTQRQLRELGEISRPSFSDIKLSKMTGRCQN